MLISRLLLAGGALCALGLGCGYIRRKIDRARNETQAAEPTGDEVNSTLSETPEGRDAAGQKDESTPEKEQSRPEPQEQGKGSTLQSQSNGIAAPAKDRLERIKGIGPVYAKKLVGAGITTFAALGDLTPDEVQRIVAPDGKGTPIDPEAWIDQARRLAQS